MIKTHYPWWGYIKYVIQQYPVWNRIDKTETPDAIKNGMKAVQDAILETERMNDGISRMNVIRLVHWDKTHTVAGAAIAIHCSDRTAGYWQREFFELTAKNRGLLE